MTALSALWLPILLSAIAVFVLSSVLHMMAPWHKGDYSSVPDEEAARTAIGALNIPAGDYLVPRPLTRSDMGSEAFAEKIRTGPNLIMTVIANGPRSMATYLVQWFIYLLVVTLFAAFIAACALPPGAAVWSIHKFIGIVAFAGYSLALSQVSIWYHRRWSTTLKAAFDGGLYAIVTALVFGWLWPK